MKKYHNMIDVQSTYRNVVKKCPNMKRAALNLEYLPMLATTPIALDASRLSFSPWIKPSLIISPWFLKLKEEEKEVTIAHELGHYDLIKNYGPVKLRNYHRWLRRSNDDELYARDKWLQKWSLIHELYADNFAFKAGYGRQSLKFLRKLKKEHPLSERGEIEVSLRIENLEKKLGEKK